MPVPYNHIPTHKCIIFMRLIILENKPFPQASILVLYQDSGEGEETPF